MKLVTETALVSLLCSAVLLAEDEPKKAPPLPESLKELEWLVGEWEVKTQTIQENAAAASREHRPNVNGTFEPPASAVRVENPSIASGDDGKSLTFSYSIGFDSSSPPYELINVKDTVVYDAESGNLVGEYAWRNATRSVLFGYTDVHGRYSVKKTSEDCWTGNGSCTYSLNRIMSIGPPITRRSGHFSITLAKHDKDSFSVAYTARVDCPYGPNDITVHFIRKQKKQE